MKETRVVNKELLDEIKKRNCIICGSSPCDPCHLKTVGSGGDDTEENVVPMCRRHHSEQHNLGIKSFYDKYFLFRLAVKERGLKFENVFGKWYLTSSQDS